MIVGYAPDTLYFDFGITPIPNRDPCQVHSRCPPQAMFSSLRDLTGRTTLSGLYIWKTLSHLSTFGWLWTALSCVQRVQSQRRGCLSPRLNVHNFERSRIG